MVVCEKTNFEAQKIKKIFIRKIILHNYILCKGNLTYVRTFPVKLRIALIFTDFPTGSGSAPVLCWKSVNIRGIPESTGKSYASKSVFSWTTVVKGEMYIF